MRAENPLTKVPRATMLVFGLTVLLSACSLFSQTPDPEKRSQIRSAISYGIPIAEAESKLSGLGFACSNRQGNFIDESGHRRSAEHFLFCEQRPARISFTCENRDQVTVIARNDAVSGIEVLRGPSCIRQ